MFRHKDRLLKYKRLEKKRNHNKENKPVKLIKHNFILLHEHAKPIQQALTSEYGLKVHKNYLRDNDISSPEIICGNSNTELVNKMIHIIDTNHQYLTPYDTNKKHDITKWSTTKKKQNLRKQDRKEKIRCYCY